MIRKRIDPVIFFVSLGLVAFGVVMVFSASHILALDRYGDAFYFVKRHVLWAVVGFACMLVISQTDPRLLRKIAFPLMFASVIALLMVFAPGIGKEAGGARRWLMLGPVSFQPAEAAKLVLVIFLAHFLALKGERLNHWMYGFLPPVGFAGIILGLILIQPDLGTATLTAAVVGVLLYLAGARTSHLGVCALATGFVLLGMVVLAPWRMKRIFAFWDPFAAAKGAGYQLIQSLLAIARGGLAGLGLGEGKQKLFYLPEPHTDFIYAVVGEELGLIGALCVAAAFVVLLWRGFQIAMRCEDSFSALLAAGVTFLVTAQGFLNMAVATGLLPTTGIPLPLISLGGSSLVFTLISLGVLISIESSNQAPGESGGRSPLDAAIGWISRARKPVLRRRARS